ncbi:hypothetical protein Tco_0365978 [Tanacetum coccineum]
MLRCLPNGIPCCRSHFLGHFRCVLLLGCNPSHQDKTVLYDYDNKPNLDLGVYHLKRMKSTPAVTTPIEKKDIKEAEPSTNSSSLIQQKEERKHVSVTSDLHPKDKSLSSKNQPRQSFTISGSARRVLCLVKKGPKAQDHGIMQPGYTIISEEIKANTKP